MGCSGCSTTINGIPSGCKSKGSCATGGCNKMNTFDWLNTMDIQDYGSFDLVEVSFKNGSRKGFYHNANSRAIIGDMVVVDAESGYDIGQISLTGELVRLQMKKKRLKDDYLFRNIIRRANQRDLEKLHEARKIERSTMVRARVIARTLGLEMKVGDVEYQGDKRKATFYYTADGRVDFRELIRHFAQEFKIKIEMRQIGARQESGRIGGLGSCGRELCCSTWLTDFKSVSTTAARYQNLAINQSKLSGQCGRLKCCLNYELDTYMDALQHFPKNVDYLETEVGRAHLSKTDIFKGLMYYTYSLEGGRNKTVPLKIEVVKEVKAMNKNGEKPVDFTMLTFHKPVSEEEMEFDFIEDVTGAVELPIEKKKKRRGKKRRFSGKKKDNRPQNKKGGGPKKKDNRNKKKQNSKGSNSNRPKNN